MAKVKGWVGDNIVAIVLVTVFIPIFLWDQKYGTLLNSIGTTSVEFLNNEYYRWVTCIFYHYDFFHIFFNSIALLCIGSLLSPFLGRWRTLAIFMLGGALAEIPFSIIVRYKEVNYGGGSSGGIFALIAAFLVCYLRFPAGFALKWFRPDLLVILIYFVLANENQSSFLTHAFGFIAGILLTTIMVVFGLIRENMDIQRLSSHYIVRTLTEQDVDKIYELSVGNPLYYQHYPPFVTRESILVDMRALPPRMTYEDKYYIGFWKEQELVAVMDFVTNYPNKETVFIGFFMMDKSLQGMGIGSSIIEDCCSYFKSEGYHFARLCYAKSNPQSKAFWKKNGFMDTGIEDKSDGNDVVILQKNL